MPRLSVWNGEYNDNMDFCVRCVPSEEKARKDWAKEVPAGESLEESITVHDDHPDYEGDGYRCYNCNQVLRDRDN